MPNPDVFGQIWEWKPDPVPLISILKHSIAHLFLPLDIDFQGLKEVDKKTSIKYAQEIIIDRNSNNFSYLRLLADLQYLIAKIPDDKTSLKDDDLPDGKCVWDLVKKFQNSDEVKMILDLCGLRLGKNGNLVKKHDSSIQDFFSSLDKAKNPEKFLKSKDDTIKVTVWCNHKSAEKNLTFHQWFTQLEEAMDELRSTIKQAQQKLEAV